MVIASLLLFLLSLFACGLTEGTIRVAKGTPEGITAKLTADGLHRIQSNHDILHINDTKNSVCILFYCRSSAKSVVCLVYYFRILEVSGYAFFIYLVEFWILCSYRNTEPENECIVRTRFANLIVVYGVKIRLLFFGSCGWFGYLWSV